MQPIKNLVVISVLLLSLFSCQKAEYAISDKNDMLVFKDEADFSNTVKKVSSMSEQERIAWEEAKGFTSFATICNAVYEKARPENFQTREEVFVFVANNDQYLELIEKEGEYTLETKLWYKADRFLLNEDCMMQIGDKVFKIFESGTASAAIEQKNVLKNMTEMEYKASLSEEPMLIAGAYGLADYYEKDATEDRDRIHFRISCDKKGQTYRLEYMVRPYKKTLGIWYFCNRTLQHYVRSNFAYTDANGRFKEAFFGDSHEMHTGSPVSHSYMEYTITESCSEGGFTAFKCWAKSSTVGQNAELNINDYRF